MAQWQVFIQVGQYKYQNQQKQLDHMLGMEMNTGIPRFTLLMWGHIKNSGKWKPRELRLLCSTRGEENRIEL